jgi:hypothetical protein
VGPICYSDAAIIPDTQDGDPQKAGFGLFIHNPTATSSTSTGIFISAQAFEVQRVYLVTTWEEA